MPMGRLRAWKSQPESHVFNLMVSNYLLTSNVRSLQENLKPRPCRIDLVVVWSTQQGLGLKFSRKGLTLS